MRGWEGLYGRPPVGGPLRSPFIFFTVHHHFVSLHLHLSPSPSHSHLPYFHAHLSTGAGVLRSGRRWLLRSAGGTSWRRRRGACSVRAICDNPVRRDCLAGSRARPL